LCDVKDIKKALLGEDGTGMNSGIVHEITLLKVDRNVSASWISFLKPVAVSVVSTAVLTYLITRFG
jgi:hypothetical protein